MTTFNIQMGLEGLLREYASSPGGSMPRWKLAYELGMPYHTFHSLLSGRKRGYDFALLSRLCELFEVSLPTLLRLGGASEEEITMMGLGGLPEGTSLRSSSMTPHVKGDVRRLRHELIPA